MHIFNKIRHIPGIINIVVNNFKQDRSKSSNKICHCLCNLAQYWYRQGDVVDSTQDLDQVQLRGGNGNIIVAGDGVNIRNHIVDTYFT